MAALLIGGWSRTTLTGAQGGGRDLDLTGSLVGLEGGGSAPGAELGGEQVGALGARGAGAGPIAAVVGLLLLVHRHQLQEAEGGVQTRGARRYETESQRGRSGPAADHEDPE